MKVLEERRQNENSIDVEVEEQLPDENRNSWWLVDGSRGCGSRIYNFERGSEG